MAKKLTTLEQLKQLALRTKQETTKINEKIQEIVTAGGEPNKIEAVNVNGVALPIANKIVDILITTGTSNGAISVAGVDVLVKGLAALAFKAEVSEAELSAALKTVIDNKADKSALDTLIGTDTGKSARAIAAEELAKQLIPDNAKESMDSLTELAAWIQDHPDDAAAMNKAISDLANLVGTLPEGTVATTVVGYIQEVAQGIRDEIDSMVATDEEVNAMLDEVFGAAV